jgi:hypothetical protein
MALVGVVTQRRAPQVPEEFMRLGGTELAPMSTTTDLATAMTYVKPERERGRGGERERGREGERERVREDPSTTLRGTTSLPTG